MDWFGHDRMVIEGIEGREKRLRLHSVENFFPGKGVLATTFTGILLCVVLVFVLLQRYHHHTQSSHSHIS